MNLIPRPHQTTKYTNQIMKNHISTILGKYGLLDKWFGVFLYIYRQPRPHQTTKYTNQIMKNHISTILGKYGLLDKWFGVFLYIYRQPRPQCQ
jgi:muramidase (phage lysozyme)